jgi:anti-sigma factor RsiW
VSPVPISDDLLQAYVDDHVTAAQRAEIESYLALHPAQAERVAAYRRQQDALKEAFANVLHEPVPERISVQRLNPRRLRPTRVAAIFAWIVVGALLGWALRGQIETASLAAQTDMALVARARTAHVIYAAETRRAVEVAASQEEDMIRWLSKRMNTAVRVPKLSEFGFEALGGRLLPGEQGPACQIMYQNQAGKRLTIYLARDPRGTPKPIRFSDKEAVHVVFWSDGTLAFAVSAELSNEELQRIAAVVAQGSRL